MPSILYLALVFAFLVVVIVAALYTRVGKGHSLAGALTTSGLLGATVWAFFHLAETLIRISA